MRQERNFSINLSEARGHALEFFSSRFTINVKHRMRVQPTRWRFCSSCHLLVGTLSFLFSKVFVNMKSCKSNVRPHIYRFIIKISLSSLTWRQISQYFFFFYSFLKWFLFLPLCNTDTLKISILRMIGVFWNNDWIIEERWHRSIGSSNWTFSDGKWRQRGSRNFLVQSETQEGFVGKMAKNLNRENNVVSTFKDTCSHLFISMTYILI